MVIRSVVLTILFEAITVVLRFGMQMESTRDTASTIGVLTMGIRIHHGYVGAVLVLLSALIWEKSSSWYRWMVPVGVALIFSDLIHHFLVLWPITGDPQFHLVYPE